jgi:hypothetical protein
MAQETYIWLRGRNPLTRNVETHAFYNAGVDDTFRYVVRVGSNEPSDPQQLDRQAAVDKYVHLWILGMREVKFSDNPMWYRAFNWVELFLRLNMTLVFLLALFAASVYYAIEVGIREWYEWVAFVAALAVGTLLSRARELSFPGGFKIRTEEWTDQTLYEQQTRTQYWQGWFDHASTMQQGAPESNSATEVREPK